AAVHRAHADEPQGEALAGRRLLVVAQGRAGHDGRYGDRRGGPFDKVTPSDPTLVRAHASSPEGVKRWSVCVCGGHPLSVPHAAAIEGAIWGGGRVATADRGKGKKGDGLVALRSGARAVPPPGLPAGERARR